MASHGALKRRFAIVLLALAGLVLMPSAVFAHSELVRSTPAANSSLGSAPARITLTFSEVPEARLSRVQVFDVRHQRLDASPLAAVPGDPLSLAERLQPDLPRGVYTVAWQATSADDGHVTGGSYAFGVGVVPGASAAPQLAPSWESQAWPDGLVRWVGYLSVLGLLGLLVFRLAVLGRMADLADPAAITGAGVTIRRCVAAGQWLAGIAVLAAAATIVSQAAQSGGLRPAAIEATLGTSLGHLLVLRLAVALGMLAVVLAEPGSAERAPHRSPGAAAAITRASFVGRRHFRQELLLALTLGEVLLLALTSHAPSVPTLPQLAVAIDWLHLSLAGIWVGGLIALVLALLPVRTRAVGCTAGLAGPGLLSLAVLKRFSALALAAAAGLALTGFYQGFVHVGSLGNALSTDYGRALMIKTAIFAAALLVAAVHRFAVLPGYKVRGTLLTRTLPLEAALSVGILAVAGVLTSLPPANQVAANGASPEQQSAALGPVAPGLPRQGDLTLAGNAGDTLVGITLRPGRPGPNQLLVYVLPSGGAAAAGALSVSGQLNGASVALHPCAATCRAGQMDVRGGEQLAVRVGQDTATFSIPRLPAPAGEALLQRLNGAAHQLRTYRVDETLAPAQPPVRTLYAYQAPDRWSFDSSTGAQAVWIGHTRFSRSKPEAPWTAEQIDQPAGVPFFIWDDGAPQTPLITGSASLDGRPTQVLTFYEWLGAPVWFRVWVGPDGLPRRAQMRAAGHFMDQQFSGFDTPLSVQPPTA